MPAVGEIIDGTFRIVRRLGSGAAATTFEVSLTRAWDEHDSGTTFCLKWYSDEMFKREAESTVIARRVREAVVGGSLRHPNLVRVYDTSEFWLDGRPRFLLMELIRGETLAELVGREPVDSHRAHRLLLDTARGLKALHDRAVLHRDVKASNVMVDSDGRTVLLDLGVVRPETEATMTDSQGFLGTMRFAAPEWLFAEKCSAASDVYSLGTIGYHLLTGHEIFNDIRVFSRVIEAVRGRDAPITRDGWDPRRRYLANATQRMLAKEPKNRPSLEEVLDVLQDDRRFQVWLGLEEGGVFSRLPEQYQTDGESQRALVHLVLDVVPEGEFKGIVERRDYDRIINHKEVRLLCNLGTIDENVEEYLHYPPERRVEWARRKLASINRDEQLSLGAQIEASWTFMTRLCEVEPVDQVRRELQPLLDAADEDMSEMIRDMAQDNP